MDFGNATKVPVYREVPVAQDFYFFFLANRHNLPRICIEMAFYEYFLDFLANVGTRGLRISPQHGLEDVVVFVFAVNFQNHARCSPFLLNKSSMVQEIFNSGREKTVKVLIFKKCFWKRNKNHVHR